MACSRVRWGPLQVCGSALQCEVRGQGVVEGLRGARGHCTQGQMTSNIETQVFANRERIKQLRDEHRDLDLAIAEMSTKASSDQFMLKRMKKRKLRLKDMIARLESEQIPDLNA